MVVIGVNTGGLYDGDDEALINAFIQQTGVTFPVVMDGDQVVPYEAGSAISPFPVDVIVDPDGIISAIYTEYDPDTLLAAINAAR